MGLSWEWAQETQETHTGVSGVGGVGGSARSCIFFGFHFSEL